MKTKVLVIYPMRRKPSVIVPITGGAYRVFALNARYYKGFGSRRADNPYILEYDG